MSDWVRVWRKKVGGRVTANPAACCVGADCAHDVLCDCAQLARDQATIIRGAHERIRELEDRIQVLLHCDIAELKARIVELEAGA